MKQNADRLKVVEKLFEKVMPVFGVTEAPQSENIKEYNDTKLDQYNDFPGFIHFIFGIEKQ